jgi:hypothetical protein
MIPMAYGEDAKRFVRHAKYSFRFSLFFALFPLVEAGRETGDRLLRRCRDGRLDAQQRLAITGQRRVKVAQKST